MINLFDLWLPILLSAVFVFVVSSVVHMVLPIHKGDYQKIPGEVDVLGEMRNQGVEPGCYMFPCPSSMKDMGSPEMLEKYERGPVGFLTVVPSGAPNMGKSLVQWFLLSLVISVFVAYIAHIGLDRSAEYMEVFRITSCTAILGYATGNVSNSIWKGESWCTTFKFVFDGVVYGLVTAGTFGWLWPGLA